MELTLADAVALVLSGWAVFQTSRHRGSGILFEAIKERAAIVEMLRGLDGAFVELHEGWRALFAAKRMFESGARLAKEQYAEKLQARIDELYGQLDLIMKPEGWRARRKAELTLPLLLELRARVSSLVAAVEAERLSLRSEQEAFRLHQE